MSASVKTVGAYEAKTNLASLLDQVAKGKEIIITKREKPIARLVPIASSHPDRQGFFQRIRDLRGRLTPLPKGETIKDLINAGRRI
jgi:prevent-host-death family protein